MNFAGLTLINFLSLHVYFISNQLYRAMALNQYGVYTAMAIRLQSRKRFEETQER